MKETRIPRLSRRAPMDAEVSPLPREETTPPVTKMNLVDLRLPLAAVMIAFFLGQLAREPPRSQTPLPPPGDRGVALVGGPGRFYTKVREGETPEPEKIARTRSRSSGVSTPMER